MKIYLTERALKELRALTHATGKSRSELIRNAVDWLIMQQHKSKHDKLAAIQAAKGIWKDRNSLAGLAKLRQEFDRY